MLKLAPLFLGVIASYGGAFSLQAQPSYEAPPPSRVVIEDQAERRAGYLSRLQELRDWRLAQVDWDDPKSAPGYSEVAFLLHRNERIEVCNRRVIALPLEYSLDPVPSVKMTTLRGKEVSFTYGATPLVNEEPLDYAKWKLFAGTHLNAELGSRKLTITHGALKRVLDLNTLTITNTP